MTRILRLYLALAGECCDRLVMSAVVLGGENNDANALLGEKGATLPVWGQNVGSGEKGMEDIVPKF